MTFRSLVPLAMLVACGFLPAQSPPILLTGNLYDGNGGPLLSGQVYHVVGGPGSCGVVVPQGRTLTIQPGAMIKVDGCWNAPGRIVARGTAQSTIPFTSIHDDTVGGDTNGNGNATVPQPGDWPGLDFFNDPGTVFEHCVFSYGGTTNGTTFNLRNKQVSFRNCVFEWAAGDALTAADNVTADNCLFRDLGGLPARNLALRNIQQFTDNQAMRCAGGDYALINDGRFFPGNLVMDHRFSMNGSGLFVFEMGTTTSPVIPAGTHWTLPAGTIFKFAAGGIFSSGGRLLARGTSTAPVFLTVLEDDTVGGDTNKDGSTTQPTPGDWLGIELQNGDTSVLQHTTLRYGGAAQQLLVHASSMRLENVAVERSAGHGVAFRNLPATPASLVDCRIDDNALLPVSRIQWTTLAECEGISTSGNGSGDHFHVQPERPNAPIVIEPDNFPGDVLVVGGRTIINAGGRLTLPAGTIVKHPSRLASGFSVNTGAGLFLQGTARRPVVITSIKDDSWGGDTNGDGNATQPAPDDIGQIWIGSGAGTSVLRNVLYRYGTSNSIEVQASNAALRSVRVDFANGTGIRLVDVQGDVLNAVVFGCTGNGIEVHSNSFDLLHATVANNIGSGIKRTAGWTGLVVNSVSWGNGMNFELVPASQVSFSNGGFAGQNGNINMPPMFANAAGGELRLQNGSPCLGAADPTTAIAVASDHDENSRVLDHGLTGTALPDMGAYERAAYRLAVTGQPELGATMGFTVQGPAGASLVVIGLQDGAPPFVAPFGVLLSGLTSAVLAIVPVGQQVPFALPSSQVFAGFPFAAQGLGLQVGSPTAGNFTNVDRNVLR